jgi:RND family efflux transporter MFP subunit
MLLIRQLLLTIFIVITAASSADLAVTPAQKINVDHQLRFTGTVEAVNQGTASSQTSGRVEETLVDVGDLVQKNDIILQLRDTQQRANFQTAQAGVKAAQAQYDSAEKEYQRIKDIRARGLVSQSQLDNALASRDGAKAALDAANGRLADAEEQLEFTRVRAPYSGIVLERHIEVGELVNPGTPLYTGMSLERLRVIADVPQKDINAIRQFKKATIAIPTGQQINITDPDLTFFGYADPVTSTFKIRAYLPEGTEGLYPGMYIPTSFKVGVKEVLVVPKQALVHRGEVTAVYIQQADKINFRQVKAGMEHITAEGDTVVEILSGVQEGESIILSPVTAIALIKSQAE